MSYGVVYRLPFIDEAGNNKRVDLLQRDYSGSITESTGVGYSPVFLSLEGQGARKDRTLWGTEIVANLFAETDFEYLDLLKTASEREFRLDLYQNDTLKHAGYIIPDSVSEAYADTPYAVRVGGVSLGALQGIPYKDGSNFYEGRESVMTVITRCLNKLEFGFDIWDSVNTYEDGMNPSDSPLTQADVDQDSFIFDDRGRRKALSCYDVLERVLKPFVVNLFQDNGAWKIIPIELRGQSRTVRVFNSSGVLQSTTTHDPEDTTYKWVGGGGNLRTLPALREIESVYDHGLVPDLVSTGQFNDDFNDEVNPQFGGLPNSWDYSDESDFIGFSGTTDGTVISVPLRVDDGGPRSLRMEVNPAQPAGNSRIINADAYIEYTGKYIESGTDEFGVALRFSYRASAGDSNTGSEFTQKIRVSVGSEYLGADGTWTNTPTDIEITDLTTGRLDESYSVFNIISEVTTVNDVFKVRIYRPERVGVAPTLANKGDDISFSKYPFISVEYFPDGDIQNQSKTYVGTREVESFAEEVEYELNHGDGPTNIHPSAFTLSGSKTESWERGLLTGGISQIAIRAIAGETQLPYNVITGNQRTEGTFDRYFTDQGTKYIVGFAKYDERKNYMQGDYVEQFESTTTISISEFEEQQSGPSQGSSGGGGGTGTRFDDRYFRINQNLSEGNASTIRSNIGLGTIATFAGDQDLRESDDVRFEVVRVGSGVIKGAADFRFEQIGSTTLRRIHIGDPTADTHSATKKYVDDGVVTYQAGTGSPNSFTVARGEQVTFVEGNDISLSVEDTLKRITIGFDGTIPSDSYINGGTLVLSGGATYSQQLTLIYNDAKPNIAIDFTGLDSRYLQSIPSSYLQNTDVGSMAYENTSSYYTQSAVDSLLSGYMQGWTAGDGSNNFGINDGDTVRIIGGSNIDVGLADLGGGIKRYTIDFSGSLSTRHVNGGSYKTSGGVSSSFLELTYNTGSPSAIGIDLEGLDGRYVPASGGTFTGAVIFTSSFQYHTINEGWARGLDYRLGNDTSTRSGFLGAYGGGFSVERLFLAYGASPWSSGEGLYVIPTSGGRVGINKTTPVEALDVVGFVRSSSGYRVAGTTVITSGRDLTNIVNTTMSGTLTMTSGSYTQGQYLRVGVNGIITSATVSSGGAVDAIQGDDSQPISRATVTLFGGTQISTSANIPTGIDIDYTGVSDISLKQDIEPLGDVWTQLMMLQPVSFNWIANKSNRVRHKPEYKNIGFIANHFARVMPELSLQRHDGLLGVDYPHLTAVLTKAVQDLKNENTFLNQRIEEMQKEINNQKAA